VLVDLRIRLTGRAGHAFDAIQRDAGLTPTLGGGLFAGHGIGVLLLLLENEAHVFDAHDETIDLLGGIQVEQSNIVTWSIGTAIGDPGTMFAREPRR